MDLNSSPSFRTCMYHVSVHVLNFFSSRLITYISLIHLSKFSIFHAIGPTEWEFAFDESLKFNLHACILFISK